MVHVCWARELFDSLYFGGINFYTVAADNVAEEQHFRLIKLAFMYKKVSNSK